jgi:hypothetical protein
MPLGGAEHECQHVGQHGDDDPGAHVVTYGKGPDRIDLILDAERAWPSAFPRLYGTSKSASGRCGAPTGAPSLSATAARIERSLTQCGVADSNPARPNLFPVILSEAASGRRA